MTKIKRKHFDCELIFDRSLHFYRRSERFLLALLSQSWAVEVIWPCFWYKKYTLLQYAWSAVERCMLYSIQYEVYWVTTVFTERGSKREEYFWLFFAFAIVNVFLSSFLLRLLLILLLWLKHFMVSYISFEQYLWFPHNSFYLKSNVHCYSFRRMWIAIARTKQICDRAIGHTINRYSCIKCSCRQSTAKEREREREKKPLFITLDLQC